MPAQSELALLQLAQQILGMAQSATADPKVDAWELRRVLKFLTKMVQVVDQAFQDVYATLIDVKLLKPEDLGTEKITALQRELAMTFTRSWYRDTEEICSRLHHLSEQYQSQIAPIVDKLDQPEEWREIFYIINEHEGRILFLVKDAAQEIGELIGSLYTPSEIAQVKLVADQKAQAIYGALQLLLQLRNRIFGLSGVDGFLEMTDLDRGGIGKEINLMIDQSVKIHDIVMGDRISVGNISNAEGVAIGKDIVQNIHPEE